MTHTDYIDGILTDNTFNTLHKPHSFVSEEWLKDNGLFLDAVSCS